MEVNVHEAKTHLSRLLRRVSAGEEITISRAGTPVAKLIAAHAQATSRPLGMDRGKIYIADDFDESDPKLESLFDGPVTTEIPTDKPSRKRQKR